MPISNIVLMMLIGIVFGTLASVMLRVRRSVMIINLLLGMFGATIGAFFPIIVGQSATIDVTTPEYLIRGIMGAFLLVVLAGLFRPVKPPGKS